MIVVRTSSWLFLLHPVLAYTVHPRLKNVARSPSAPAHCVGKIGTRLPSINPQVSAGIVDHATLSIDDIWEDHYTQFSSDDDAEGRYRSPSHFYVSPLVSAMNDQEVAGFLLQHEEQQSAMKGRSNGRQPQGSTAPSVGTAERANRPQDTYTDEPYRQLRLLRRRLPDPLWSQIRLEAEHALADEPDAGPQLYQHVLRQPSLMDALASIISHEIGKSISPTILQIACANNTCKF